MLVTPWFAAGAGILIAAALVLESPTNAVLSYGPPSSGVPCQTPGCATIVPRHAPDALATAKPGTQLNASGTQHAPASPLRRKPPRPPAARVSVSFRVFQQQAGRFVGVITLLGAGQLGNWTLAFTLPGASISGVAGAGWQRNASGDGGVASGQSLTWRQPASLDKTARIVIFGTGTPGRPGECVLDGSSCDFSQVRSAP